VDDADVDARLRRGAGVLADEDAVDRRLLRRVLGREEEDLHASKAPLAVPPSGCAGFARASV
jgi:hypothetical protein